MYVLSAFTRTVSVRLKPDSTYVRKMVLLPQRLGESFGSWLELNPEGIQRHRDHPIAAGGDEDVEQLSRIKDSRQLTPRRVRHHRVAVKLVDRAQQSDVDWIASRARALDDPFEVDRRQPRPSPGWRVRGPLVLGAAQHAYSDDQQLTDAHGQRRLLADVLGDARARLIHGEVSRVSAVDPRHLPRAVSGQPLAHVRRPFGRLERRNPRRFANQPLVGPFRGNRQRNPCWKTVRQAVVDRHAK